MMDASDLFRKLGAGAKFDFKRFQTDASRLKIRHTVRDAGETSSNGPTSALKRPNQESPTFQRQKRLKSDKNQEQDAPREARSDSSDSGSDEDDDDDDDDDDGSESVVSGESDDEAERESDGCEDESEKEDEHERLQLLGDIRSEGEIKDRREKKKKEKQKKMTTAKLALLKQEKVNHFRRLQHIHTYGADVPDPVETFEQLQNEYSMHSRIIANLSAVGFDAPTPVQMQAVPAMLHRREVLCCAPTGSGKTAAFILPVLHHLKEPRKKGFRALILAPTRELAKQIHGEFCRLSEGLGFRIHLIEKGQNAAKKFGQKSSQKFDILVTTPNRLVFLLQQDPPGVVLSNVEWLVVDESDKLFEEGKTGFRDQLATIYKSCDSVDIRRAFFSATYGYGVEEWCHLNLDNILQVYVGARNSATDTIKQELIFVGNESGKLIAMRDIIQKGFNPPVLVFVQSKVRAKELFHELIYDGINVDVIHSDRTQTQRDNTIKSFRTGHIWVLICTELMGRGIDFKGVNLIINYDFPNSAISYIHRIGRTGRAGRAGSAITLFTEDDAVNLRSIANVMREAGCPVPDYMLQIAKPNRKKRKELARSELKRRSIRTIPQHEIKKSRHKRKSLKRTQKGSGMVQASHPDRTALVHDHPAAKNARVDQPQKSSKVNGRAGLSKKTKKKAKQKT